MRRALTLTVGCLVAIVESAYAQTSTPTTTPTPTSTPTFTQTRTPTQRVRFAEGYEFCTNTNLTHYWQDDAAATFVNSSGHSVVRTPAPKTEAGNKCQWKIDAPAGTATYKEFTITAASAVGDHYTIRLDTIPAISATRRLFSYRSNASSKNGCMIYVEGLTATTYRLKLYYEDTGYECAGATNDGTECTSAVTDCTENHYNEAVCGDSAYGATGSLTVGSYYGIGFGQLNAPSGIAGAVKCELWLDDDGSVVNQVTGAVRFQGKCAATGDHSDDACGSSSDCGTSTPCSTTDVVDIDRIRVGPDDTAATAITMYVDDLAYADNPLSALRRARIEPMYPSGDASGSGWTKTGGCSAYSDCIDDLATGDNDQNTTTITSGSSNQERAFILTDLATMATGEKILGLSTEVIGNPANTGSALRRTRTGINRGGTTYGTYFDFNNISQSDSTYYPAAYSLVTVDPGTGVLFTEANANNASAVLHKLDGGDTHYTTMHSEALISQPLPDCGSTLTDQNGDSQITLCITGDSRFNYGVLGERLATNLCQVDNLIQCAEGGTTLEDLQQHISEVLSSTTGSYFCSAADVKKGVGNRYCDYLFIDDGVNTVYSIPTFPRAGYCYDWNGVQHGNACRCEVKKSTAAPPTYYCWGNIPGEYKLACDGVTTCEETGGVTCSADCINSAGCNTGVCVQEYNFAAYTRDLGKLFDTIAAHPSHTKVILSLPWFANVLYSNGGSLWPSAQDTLGAQRAWYLDQASRRGWDWVDPYKEFVRRCSPWQSCLQDFIHPSSSAVGINPTGNDVIADLLEGCLEQDSAFINKSCTHL